MTTNYEKREGLLGGSFDPVHLGHLGLAQEALDRFQLDTVKFIPTHISPHKQEQLVTPSHHRWEMLRLAIGANPQFVLSDIELKRQGVSYTIDTCKTLRNSERQTEFYLVMAGDTFNDLATWKDFQYILESCNLLVGSRPGFPLQIVDSVLRGLYPESIPYQFDGSGKNNEVDYWRPDNGRRLCFFNLTDPRNISSSEIRSHVQQNLSVKNLLPPPVEHYIIENNLYKFTVQNPRPTKE